MQYSEDYAIIIPRLKNQSGHKVSYNPVLGDWTYDFDKNVLSELGLNSISFNFFILWNDVKTDGDFYNNVWLKREISAPEGETINLNTPLFHSKLAETTDHDGHQKDVEYLEKHKTTFSYIILKDVTAGAHLEDEDFSAMEVLEDGKDNIYVKRLTYGELKRVLVERSNGRFVMSKSLYTYETEIEHILSKDAAKTGAVFPGDCDMMLYDDELHCVYLCEYKKCTRYGAKIPVEQQSISNYIKKDRNKYLRLNILREYFERYEKSSIPLINVFYPTTAETKIKLEEIRHDLTSGKSVVYDMAATPIENQRLLLQMLTRHY